MISGIKNILTATDLTRNSSYAFRYAIHSAQKYDAQTDILYVLEKLTPSEEANRPYRVAV
jgi:nucleotide-binding universal stress UspA family protein